MLRLFFISLLTLSISACTIKPVSDFRSELDYTLYNTFAFAPKAQGVADSIDNARIREAVTIQLAQKGLQVANINDADLQVIYRIETETELESFGNSFGVGFGGKRSRIAFSTPDNYYEREYGKLVLEFLDPNSQAIIWQSISQRQLHEKISTDKRTEFINAEIKLMLNAYPPQVK